MEHVILSDVETTFQYDKDLLTLPVPDLGNTLKKYLESVRPLVTDEEYKKTELIVQQFASGEGKYLQEKLKEKAKSERNWLEEWWQDVAYLEVRMPGPLMCMAGPGPYCEDVWPAEPGTQIQRAAMAQYYALKFWDYIRREKNKPLRDGKGRPLCMDQFRKLFNTCTIPGVKKDKLMNYFQTVAEGPCPTHIAVTSKGHIFTINVVDEENEIITVPELEMQFQRIVDHSKSVEPAEGVPYLTAEERTKWARARNQLIALSPNNYEILEAIQASIMLVFFEDGNGGPDLTTLTNNALLGCGDNRWFDKSMCSGCYEDGLIVSCGDHTPVEGMMMVYVTSYIHAKLKECNGRWQGSKKIRPLPEPKLWKFDLNDDLRSQIEDAKKMYNSLRKSAVAELVIYNNYGKNYCKQKKFHPDAHAQLAMHLAYYTMHGRMAPTYETAPIKIFYHGRTETLRSCTNEAKAWCQAMHDPRVKNSDRFKLYANAVNKHNFEMAEACELRGCDRHLLGLMMIAREEGRPIPFLYQDPSFMKSGGGGNYILSTSCIGYTTALGGVLPMCKNGYGAFYRINDNRFTYYITTWTGDSETSCKGLGKAICKALDDMKILVDQEEASPSARM